MEIVTRPCSLADWNVGIPSITDVYLVHELSLVAANQTGLFTKRQKFQPCGQGFACLRV